MIIWGVTAMTHDAAVSVIRDSGEILFAAHAERYSKQKFDKDLHPALIDEARSYGEPDVIAFYENPWKKRWRQFKSGHLGYVFDMQRWPKRYMKSFGLKASVKYVDHHISHAAAAYFTSHFSEATAVVIDAVGEVLTASVWHVIDGEFKLKKTLKFPYSIGLLYSAFTQRCGLKPNEEEYILMGMAAYGEPKHVVEIADDFLDSNLNPRVPVHYGIGEWMPEAKLEDLAASIQHICEKQVLKFMTDAFHLTKCAKLVYGGGVALNCVINASLLQNTGFNEVWIMPNPGDAGSSLGAAAYVTKERLKWQGPYLGTDVPGKYPVSRACDLLVAGEIVGIANGRAEFGPRALGNRSLLADPRNPDVKNKVNEVKRRQEFRPFAPAVLEEHARDWFELSPAPTPYMQFTTKCRRPDEVSAICHVDGTSRVQTVSKEDHPDFHELLQEFHRRTGCPMLLNTSLNIRGKPMVNDRADADLFEQKYGVPVL